MILAAVDLLSRTPDPSDDAIRHALRGNLCRCTGYQGDRRIDPRGRRIA